MRDFNTATRLLRGDIQSMLRIWNSVMKNTKNRKESDKQKQNIHLW